MMTLFLLVGLLLQTVFGEMLLMESLTDVERLSLFIVHRLLSDEEISRAYAHPAVPHMYRPGINQGQVRAGVAIYTIYFALHCCHWPTTCKLRCLFLFLLFS